MPAFDTPKDRDDVITVRDEKNWDAHESCRIRTIKRGGDEEWVTNQLLKLKSQQQARKKGLSKRKSQQTGIDIQSNLGSANRLWVQRMLVDWTFTKNGVLMPINDQSMTILDQTYIDYIYEQLQDAQPEDDEDEEEESDEDDEEGSTFFDGASDSTDGDTSELEEKPNGKNSRNFLLRS